MTRTERLLTVPEVAERLRTTAATVRRWLREGRLAGVMPGGTKLGYRIPETALETFMASAEEDYGYEAKAWLLFQRIPRIKRTADLHAAGFAYGELTLIAFAGGDERELHVKATPDVFRQIGLHLFVTGAASATVRQEADGIILEQGDGCEFRYVSTPGRAEKPGGLGTVVANHQALLSPYLDPGIAGQLMLAMFPPEMLSPQSAKALADVDLWQPLTNYIAAVQDMKWQFERALQRCLPDARVVASEWDPPLRPDVRGLGRPYNLGHIYQIFRTEGITLERLRADVEESLTRQTEMGAVSRSSMAEVLQSFGS